MISRNTIYQIPVKHEDYTPKRSHPPAYLTPVQQFSSSASWPPVGASHFLIDQTELLVPQWAPVELVPVVLVDGASALVIFGASPCWGLPRVLSLGWWLCDSVVVGWAWVPPGVARACTEAGCPVHSGPGARRPGAVAIHPLQCAVTRSPAQVLDVELGVCEGPSSAVALPLDDESPAVASGWSLGSLIKCLQSPLRKQF